MGWREGTWQRVHSHFLAVRVRPVHYDYWRSEPHAEQWLLLGWPRGAAEPTKFWLSNLPAHASLRELVRLAKHRWVVERDYLEFKQELGLAAPQRALVARLSPSREALYGGRRVPGGRAEPFFPLRAPGGSGSGFPSRSRATGRGAARLDQRRREPGWIATLREQVARALLSRLPLLPFLWGETLRMEYNEAIGAEKLFFSIEQSNTRRVNYGEHQSA